MLLSSNLSKYKINDMNEKKSSLQRKVVQAGGWRLVRRVAKSIPYAGTVIAVGLVGYDIRRKGMVNGILNSGLDAIPFLGAAKNALEFFTGDLIPDKAISETGKVSDVK